MPRAARQVDLGRRGALQGRALHGRARRGGGRGRELDAGRRVAVGSPTRGTSAARASTARSGGARPGAARCRRARRGLAQLEAARCRRSQSGAARRRRARRGREQRGAGDPPPPPSTTPLPSSPSRATSNAAKDPTTCNLPAQAWLYLHAAQAAIGCISTRVDLW
jgi:hypothetical protein